MNDGFYERVAIALSARLKMPIKDYGVVDGDPGTMLLWGETVPDWDAVPLPPDVAEKRLRDAANAERTIWIAVAVVLLALVTAAFL